MNDQVPGSEEPVTMKNKINEAMAVILELIIGSPFSDGKPMNGWKNITLKKTTKRKKKKKKNQLRSLEK